MVETIYCSFCFRLYSKIHVILLPIRKKKERIRLRQIRYIANHEQMGKFCFTGH